MYERPPPGVVGFCLNRDGGCNGEVDDDGEQVLDHGRQWAGSEGRISPGAGERPGQCHRNERSDRAAREQGDSNRERDLGVTERDEGKGQEGCSDKSAEDGSSRNLAEED